MGAMLGNFKHPPRRHCDPYSVRNLILYSSQLPSRQKAPLFVFAPDEFMCGIEDPEAKDEKEHRPSLARQKSQVGLQEKEKDRETRRISLKSKSLTRQAKQKINGGIL